MWRHNLISGGGCLVSYWLIYLVDHRQTHKPRTESDCFVYVYVYAIYLLMCPLLGPQPESPFSIISDLENINIQYYNLSICIWVSKLYPISHQQVATFGDWKYNNTVKGKVVNFPIIQFTFYTFSPFTCGCSVGESALSPGFSLLPSPAMVSYFQSNLNVQRVHSLLLRMSEFDVW